MSKGLVFGIVIFVGAFVGLNWALTRPLPAEPEAAVAAAPNPAEAPKTAVIKEMAKFVEKNPTGFKPQIAGIQVGGSRTTASEARQERAPNILGYDLNQSTKESLWTPQGQEKLMNYVSQNPALASQDVKQAWFSMEPNNFQQRESLLEITNGVAKVAPNDDAKNLLLNEANQYITPSDHQNQDYGGRALQYYLNNEKDPQAIADNLNRLGVPLLNLDAGRAPAAAPPADPQNH